MSKRIVLFIIIGTFLAGWGGLGGLAGLVYFVKKNRDANRVKTQAEFAAEREADRREAAASFSDPVAPTAEETRTFLPVLNNLGEALRDEKAHVAMSAIDLDRLINELQRRGLFANLGIHTLTERNRQQIKSDFSKIGQALVDNPFLRWDRTEIRRVRWSPDRKQAVVICVHFDDADPDGLPTKLRWWFSYSAGQWRFYDLEDLYMGNRMTEMMTAMSEPEVVKEYGPNPERLKLAVGNIKEAFAAVIKKDLTAAENALAKGRGLKLPPLLDATRELAEGFLAILQEQPENALKRLDAAERFHSGMPVVKLGRACAYN
jgi:hypothetical protein